MAATITADDVVHYFTKWHVRFIERPGWRTRNTGYRWDPLGVIIHHDALNDRVGTARGLEIIERGRPDLRGPLSNEWSEDDGTGYLCALGNTNNAGRMAAEAYDRLRRRLPPRGTAGSLGLRDDGPIGNTYFWSIEVHNAGDGRDPLEPGQRQNTVLSAAAMCDLLCSKNGWPLTENIVWGHDEITRRKIDPEWPEPHDMFAFRDAVGAVLYVGPALAIPTHMEDPMADIMKMFLLYLGITEDEIMSSAKLRSDVSFHTWQVLDRIDSGDGKGPMTPQRKRAELEAWARAQGLYPGVPTPGWWKS